MTDTSSKSDTDSSPETGSKFALFVDRGAVFFIGLTIGALVGISFYTEGKPFQELFEKAEPIKAPPVAPISNPGKPQDCASNFPMSPRVAEALRTNRPLRIGVFGDSFGDGIWAGTVQAFSGRKDVEIFRFSKESTGLTRYNSVNILEDTQTKLASQPIDIALFSYGANDTQGVWADGKAAPYMSPAWQQVVGGRARDIVQLVQGQGIALGWIGLPVMRRASFDAQIQQMNGFYEEVMCKLGVPFVKTMGVTQGPDGGFSKELKDPDTGKKYIARADDGIHMSVHGYRVMARPLLNKINALLTAPGSPRQASDKAAK